MYAVEMPCAKPSSSTSSISLPNTNSYSARPASGVVNAGHRSSAIPAANFS